MASSAALNRLNLFSQSRAALSASKHKAEATRAAQHQQTYISWNCSRRPSRCRPERAGRQVPCADTFLQRRPRYLLRSFLKVRRKAGVVQAMAGAYATKEARIEQAAQQAVDFFVAPNQAVALGTGPGCNFSAEHLGRRLKEGKVWNVKVVPLSAESAAAAAQAGIPLTSADSQEKIDVMLEDPDLVQEGTLSFILGRRGASGDKSVLKEQALAPLVAQYILIADSSVFVEKLQGVLPVLIEADNWEETAEEIDDLFLGDAEIWRRPTSGSAGPMGGDQPLVTDQGHFVLDVLFTEPIADIEQVAKDLESVPGIVGHGLFVNTAYAVAVGREDGVKIRTSLFKEAFRESVTQ